MKWFVASETVEYTETEIIEAHFVNCRCGFDVGPFEDFDAAWATGQAHGQACLISA